jgi:hypothetical protein
MSTPPIVLTIAQTWDGQPLPPDAQVQITIRADRDHLILRVTSPFYGDPPAPDGPPGPTPALWEHEVVELFIAGPADRYTEIEFGPHGHHLVLQLEGVRNPVQELLPMIYGARIDGDQWTGVATIPRSLLPPGPQRLGAFAIHGSGEDREYLSMVALPGTQPDFHQLDRLQAAQLP